MKYTAKSLAEIAKVIREYAASNNRLAERKDCKKREQAEYKAAAAAYNHCADILENLTIQP